MTNIERPYRIARTAAATLLALALAAACRDATAPRRNTNVVPVRPGGAFAAVNDIPPTGKGILVSDYPDPPDRTRYKVAYHNGQVMPYTVNVFFIWYGDWSSDPFAPDPEQAILPEFVNALSGSAYFSIVKLYPGQGNNRPTGTVMYRGSAYDAYSRGTDLHDEDVQQIVQAQIDARVLPPDAGGIIVVMGSPDVTTLSGFGESYCAFHAARAPQGPNGLAYQYAFIGSPARAPSKCAPQSVGPNGTLAADAAASHLAAVLFNATTDPALTAWYDQLGLEGADKCVWSFGTTYTAPNGALANVRLGARDYLLQQLWVPTKRGGACGLHA